MAPGRGSDVVAGKGLNRKLKDDVRKGRQYLNLPSLVNTRVWGADVAGGTGPRPGPSLESGMESGAGPGGGPDIDQGEY